MLTSHTQPKSYSEEYERKRYSHRNVSTDLPLPQGPTMMTDRGAYLNFLESQVDRVSAACMTVQGYESRFMDIQTSLQALETRCATHTKLIALSQQCTEEIRVDLEQKIHTILHTQQEEKKYQERALAQFGLQIQNIERTLTTLTSLETRIATLETQESDRLRQQHQINLHTEEEIHQIKQIHDGYEIETRQQVLRLDHLHSNVKQLEVVVDEQKAHISNYHQHLEQTVYETMNNTKEELIRHGNHIEIKVHESMHQLQKDVQVFHEETLDSLKQHYYNMDTDMQQLKQQLEEELDEVRSRMTAEMDEKVSRSTSMLLQKVEEHEQLMQQQVVEPLNALDQDMSNVYDSIQQQEQHSQERCDILQQQFQDLTSFMDEYVHHKGRFAHRASTVSTKNKKRDKQRHGDGSESPRRGRGHVSDNAYQSESSTDVRRRKSKHRVEEEVSDSEEEEEEVEEHKRKQKNKNHKKSASQSSRITTETLPKKSLFDEVREFMTGKHNQELHEIETDFKAKKTSSSSAVEGDLRSRIRQVVQQSYPTGNGSSGAHSAEIYVLPTTQSPAATARAPNLYPPRPPSGSLSQSFGGGNAQTNVFSSVDTDVAAGFFPPPTSSNRPPPFPLQESNPMNDMFSSFMEQYKHDQQALKNKLDTISLASSANTPGRGFDNSSFVDQDCQVEEASFDNGQVNQLTKLLTEYKKDQNIILERLDKLQHAPNSQAFHSDASYPQQHEDYLARYVKTHPVAGSNQVVKEDVPKNTKRSSSADSRKLKKVTPTTTSKSILKDTDSSAGKKVKKGVSGKGFNRRYGNDDEDYEEDDDDHRRYRENGNPNRQLNVSLPSTNSRSRSSSPAWKHNNTFVSTNRIASRFKSPINGNSTNPSSNAGFESSLSLGEGSVSSMANQKNASDPSLCDLCHHPLRKDSEFDDKKNPRHRHHHHHRCSSNTSTAVDDENTTVITSNSHMA